MTRKVFWENPYLTAHDTTVESVLGQDLTVRSTIFYAFSGGQESDAGTLQGHPVLLARKEDLEIIYTLPPDHGLVPGQAVRMEIDWTRRYRLMRLHFAAELVLELAGRTLEGIRKIGAHIAETKARIDFAWPEPITPWLPRLEAEVRAMVAADQAILSSFEDEASERRTWELPGFARVPCGGTHLRRTGEVGGIRLKRNNIGGGKERVDIFLESADPGAHADR
jgi:Ser-tRNA(Ala) deacylase AlaX